MNPQKYIVTHWRHAAFVKEWLLQTFGLVFNVKGIEGTEQLAGQQNGVYIRVPCIDMSTDRESDGLCTAAEAHGYEILTIDDAPKRARWGRRK